MAKKKNNNPLLVSIALVVLAFIFIPKKVLWLLLLAGGPILLAYIFIKTQRPREVPPEQADARSFPSENAGATNSTNGASPLQIPTNDACCSGVETDQHGGNPNVIPAPMSIPPTKQGSPRAVVHADSLVSIRISGHQDRVHPIPAAPAGLSKGVQWVPPGESVTVGGLEIPGGMLFVGIPHKNSPEPDPSLIDPRLSIASAHPDLSLKQMGYWPSYSTISPEARKAYLSWLAGGRKDPSVDIGYVFLFFYGLERRVLEDTTSEPKGSPELSAIEAETQRLLAAYGHNRSFKGYASRFLEFAFAPSDPETPGAPPVLPDEKGFELPLSLRIGLGLFARDQKPVPAEWALAWLRADPNTYLRTPALRCYEQFEVLFKQQYVDVFRGGLRLKVNRTKLKITYQPASSGLRYAEYSRTLPGLPDVGAVTAPVAELRELANKCTDALDAYSRYLGRNPDKAQALEGLLLLPIALWPTEVRAELETLKSRVGDGMILITFGDLTNRLKSSGPLSRDKMLGLAHALESLSLGIEPDVIAGSKAPKAEDKIVLFPTLPEEGAMRRTPTYEAATVTLDLSCAAAHVDGEASSHELLHLSRQIDSWAHLSDAHRKRLKARLRLGLEQPPALASLKKKLEPLAAEAKRAVGQFLAHLCQADGQVSPEEVKFLERVYKTLSLDSQLVYSDLHVAPGEPRKVAAASLPTSRSDPQKAGLPQGFTLDHARIAQLHKETEAVSALLARVFTDGTPDEAEVAQADVPAEEPANVESRILGLSDDYSSFIRHLVSRPHWSREDLGDVAADMELMLDGALEHINEAMLDMFEAPLTEGDDPIEINQELLEQIPL
ncbi:TerB N-terminal domain-containing protein [Dechloromonas denitrificans]|uniref:tellurite resistance TerB family protein n=1 Tax=Dechloromonas denitrificans TaxID=281362 RepID=UPI001CF8B520|nr:TerB N-terminal domain-containing protein [Dechloromonas denitrificans]UCV10417.1 TerB N-terminal domain-containing protein [Dechloromonas denitrificans]